MPVNMNINILIVDDHATMRRILTSLFKQIGFRNIAEVADAESALKIVRERDFSLIICDWNMEGMSGLELLKTVRNDSQLKSVPFVLVTADTSTENVVAAKTAGVSNYILKPFTAETLKQKLQSILGYF